MKREMLLMASSVSLKMSLQVRALPGGRLSSAFLMRKSETSAAVHFVWDRWSWKMLAVALFLSRVWMGRETVLI